MNVDEADALADALFMERELGIRGPTTQLREVCVALPRERSPALALALK